MATETDVANLACVKIGTEARIVDLTTDDGFAAATLKAVWNTERQAAIRDGAWNFAVQRFEAASDTLGPDETIYPWGYRFPLPALTLRLLEVFDAAREDYQLEGRAVLSDGIGPLRGKVLVDVVEPASWDALFAEAFACRLAWRVGKRIAGSAFSADQAWQEYETAIAAAKRVDARENPPLEHEESSWVTARWGAGWPGSDPTRWG